MLSEMQWKAYNQTISWQVYLGQRFLQRWKALQSGWMLDVYMHKWYIDLSTRFMPGARMLSSLSKANAGWVLPTLSTSRKSPLNVYIRGENLSSKLSYLLFFWIENWYILLCPQSNETWNLDPCSSCRCHAGEIRCAQAKCAITKCRPNETLVKPAGQCCSRCEESKTH